MLCIAKISYSVRDAWIKVRNACKVCRIHVASLADAWIKGNSILFFSIFSTSRPTQMCGSKEVSYKTTNSGLKSSYPARDTWIKGLCCQLIKSTNRSHPLRNVWTKERGKSRCFVSQKVCIFQGMRGLKVDFQVRIYDTIKSNPARDAWAIEYRKSAAFCKGCVD